MAIQAGVGVSTNRNPKVAGKEAAKKALDAAELERPDFVFLPNYYFINLKEANSQSNIASQ